MNPPQVGERRLSLRHEVALEVVIQELSHPGIVPPSAFAICGGTRNISHGGMCVRLDQPCHDAILLRCEIFVDGCPVAIPTLARVRWVEDYNQKCLVGLAFLLR